MLRQPQARNARSKRALARREPKTVENGKTALFLRATRCSQAVQDALGALRALRTGASKTFRKKNAVRPFEDAAPLEFFADKNDAALLVVGSSQKHKRPHALTFVRLFGHRVLDMLELGLDADSFRRLDQFRTAGSVAIGLRPLVLFAGAAFDAPLADEYALAKSMLLDFFRGDPPAAPADHKVDVEGLRYLISITAPDVASGTEKPPLHLRVYLISTRRSGQKLPRVEVEEMGPRMDLRIGRVQHADPDTLKDALRTPRSAAQERPKKNVSTDAMGDKLGRVHVGRQDLRQLQTRKMKGLKRSRLDGIDDDGDDNDNGGGLDADSVAKKIKA